VTCLFEPTALKKERRTMRHSVKKPKKMRTTKKRTTTS